MNSYWRWLIVRIWCYNENKREWQKKRQKKLLTRHTEKMSNKLLSIGLDCELPKNFYNKLCDEQISMLLAYPFSTLIESFPRSIKPQKLFQQLPIHINSNVIFIKIYCKKIVQALVYTKITASFSINQKICKSTFSHVAHTHLNRIRVPEQHH